MLSFSRALNHWIFKNNSNRAAASNATRTPYPSEPSEFTPGNSGVSVASCLVCNVGVELS
jgi:hypothetical protein